MKNPSVNLKPFTDQMLTWRLEHTIIAEEAETLRDLFNKPDDIIYEDDKALAVRKNDKIIALTSAGLKEYPEDDFNRELQTVKINGTHRAVEPLAYVMKDDHQKDHFHIRAYRIDTFEIFKKIDNLKSEQTVKSLPVDLTLEQANKLYETAELERGRPEEDLKRNLPHVIGNMQLPEGSEELEIWRSILDAPEESRASKFDEALPRLIEKILGSADNKTIQQKALCKGGATWQSSQGLFVKIPMLTGILSMRYAYEFEKKEDGEIIYTSKTKSAPEHSQPFQFIEDGIYLQEKDGKLMYLECDFNESGQLSNAHKLKTLLPQLKIQLSCDANGKFTFSQTAEDYETPELANLYQIHSDIADIHYLLTNLKNQDYKTKLLGRMQPYFENNFWNEKAQNTFSNSISRRISDYFHKELGGMSLKDRIDVVGKTLPVEMLAQELFNDRTNDKTSNDQERFDSLNQYCQSHPKLMIEYCELGRTANSSEKQQRLKWQEFCIKLLETKNCPDLLVNDCLKNFVTYPLSDNLISTLLNRNNRDFIDHFLNENLPKGLKQDIPKILDACEKHPNYILVEMNNLVTGSVTVKQFIKNYKENKQKFEGILENFQHPLLAFAKVTSDRDDKKFQKFMGNLKNNFTISTNKGFTIIPELESRAKGENATESIKKLTSFLKKDDFVNLFFLSQNGISVKSSNYKEDMGLNRSLNKISEAIKAYKRLLLGKELLSDINSELDKLRGDFNGVLQSNRNLKNLPAAYKDFIFKIAKQTLYQDQDLKNRVRELTEKEVNADIDKQVILPFIYSKKFFSRTNYYSKCRDKLAAKTTKNHLDFTTSMQASLFSPPSPMYYGSMIVLNLVLVFIPVILTSVIDILGALKSLITEAISSFFKSKDSTQDGNLPHPKISEQPKRIASSNTLRQDQQVTRKPLCEQRKTSPEHTKLPDRSP